MEFTKLLSVDRREASDWEQPKADFWELVMFSSLTQNMVHSYACFVRAC